MWAAALAAGLLLGVTSLVRPQVLVLAPLVAWLVASAQNQRTRFPVEGNSTPLAPRLAWQGGGNVSRAACSDAHAPPSLPCEEGGRGVGVSRGSRAGADRPCSTTSFDELGRWGRLLAPALVIVGTLAVMAPWAMRNERVFGRPVLVSANAGWNLLIGTDSTARGGWRALDPPAECREVWDEAAKDACFGQAARRSIAESPGAWLGLVPAKLAATFDLGGSGPSYLSRARPESRAAMGGPCRRWRRDALRADHRGRGAPGAWLRAGCPTTWTARIGGRLVLVSGRPSRLAGVRRAGRPAHARRRKEARGTTDPAGHVGRARVDLADARGLLRCRSVCAAGLAVDCWAGGNGSDGNTAYSASNRVRDRPD